VTTPAALGKSQSANIFGDSIGELLQRCTSSSDLTYDGEQKPNTGRLYHSPGDSIVRDPELQSSQATSLLKNLDFKALMMLQDDRVCGKSYIL
jgi:hypothetical protein